MNRLVCRFFTTWAFLRVYSSTRLLLLLQQHGKKRTTCSGLMKTALNNVVLPTLFNVVNNNVQHYWVWISPQSGVTMLNNIVDNIEQCGQAQHCSRLFLSTLNRLFVLCCGPYCKVYLHDTMNRMRSLLWCMWSSEHAWKCHISAFIIEKVSKSFVSTTHFHTPEW